MVMPYRHVAELEDLTDEEAAELMATTRQAIRVLKQVSGPHAFNIGPQPGRRRRRLAGRAPAPARRAALVRRRQLHHRRRGHQDAAAAARATPASCSPTPGADAGSG